MKRESVFRRKKNLCRKNGRNTKSWLVTANAVGIALRVVQLAAADVPTANDARNGQRHLCGQGQGSETQRFAGLRQKFGLHFLQ